MGINKILILEDNDERIKLFKENWSHPLLELTFVEHSDDAIALLKTNHFHMIFLDHDLEEKQMRYDPEDCGMRVAEFLEQNPVKSEIVIHSMNNAAAKIMNRVLPKAKCFPGLWNIKPKVKINEPMQNENL